MKKGKAIREPQGRLDKNAFTEFYLKKTNELRETLGMMKIKAIERSCLKCERPFESMGINNRLCYLCRNIGETHVESL